VVSGGRAPQIFFLCSDLIQFKRSSYYIRTAFVFVCFRWELMVKTLNIFESLFSLHVNLNIFEPNMVEVHKVGSFRFPCSLVLSRKFQ